MKISETTVAEFIRRNFNSDDFPGPKLAKFKELVDQNKDIAAAEEYCRVNDANIAEAHLAVSFLKQQN